MKEFSYKNIVFYILLIIGNSITHEKISGIIISFPEIIFIIYLLFKGKTEKAFLFHLIFSITCLAIPFTQITNPDEASYGLFNYSKLKLIGPLGVFHIILFSFFIKTIRLKVLLPTKSVFYSLYKTIIILAVSGIFLGVFGLIFFGYYLEYFVVATSYILTLFLTAFVLIRMSNTFIAQLSKMLVEVMIASPIAALIVLIFGFSSQYGNETISIIIEVVYYCMALILTYYQFKDYFLPMISFFVTGYLLLDGGMGGKGIIFMAIVLIMFLFMAFNKKATGYEVGKRQRNLRLALIPIFVIAVVQITSFFQNTDSGLFLYKLENVTLLINVFQGFDGLYLIPESPRVRIIEIMNIFRELFSNPVYFLFGKGYGAYFTDDLHLLANMDLIGAYKAEEISNNRYGGVHDSFSSIPLANGFLGIYLICRIISKYVKMIKHNFMAYAVIPWMAFTFYYNVQFGLIAMLLLFSAEFTLNFRDGQHKKEDIIY